MGRFSCYRFIVMASVSEILDAAEAALKSGRFADAIDLCEQALDLDPVHPLAHRLLALALRALERPAEAFTHATAAREAAPDDVEIMLLTGQILVELHRFEAAATLYRHALERAPERYEILSHLGVACFELDRYDEALTLFRRAFALAPQDGRVVANLGNFLDFAGTLDLALAAYAAATSLRPDDLEIRCNHAMALLRAGRFEEGWPLFEARRRVRDPVEANGVPRLPPLSAALDLRGRRVLLFHEQGFGDSLQMLRYVPLLAARGAIILLRMPPPLARLAGGVAEVLDDDARPDAIDYVCPMMSLPLVFGTVLETIPAETPYLHPPAAAVAAWRETLASLPRPRIGLVWAGSPRGGLDRRRSMDFDLLRPLFDLPGSFVNLQIGGSAGQWALPQTMPGIDPTGELTDFAETAALVANLDLVISVDTSVVHLAGGVGTPVWVMNRFSSCWRWLMGREDSPWYPGMRLFRQSHPGDWDGVVERVARALGEFTDK
jgi:Flp pilus assembly protein TadD